MALAAASVLWLLCCLNITGAAAAAPAAPPHCPALPPGLAPPKQILTGAVLHSSKIITAGQCCSNYVPLPEPPTPQRRLAKMAPCESHNSLQDWGFTASGRYPPPGSLTLRGSHQPATVKSLPFHPVYPISDSPCQMNLGFWGESD